MSDDYRVALRDFDYPIRLRGHALRREGAPVYDADGQDRGRYVGTGGRAKCSCGLLSEPGISTYAARKWHKEHKRQVAATAT